MKTPIERVVTRDRSETVALGRRLGGALRRGDVVALRGELGAGKTTLTKGIAAGLGVRDCRYVSSPSFVLVKEYRGTVPVYHFDVYRLRRAEELEEIGCEEYFYGDGVTVVEWADKAKGLLPKGCVEVRIRTLKDGGRSIEIKGLGKKLAAGMKRRKGARRER